MSEVLRDPLWQVVLGICTIIVAIVIPLVLYRKQTQKKLLSYEWNSTQLVTVNGRMKDRLQIVYDGKPIENPHLVVVRFVNSGNIPITPNDFQSDIELSFGQSAEILTAQIEDKHPNNIKVNVEHDGKKIHMFPTLLNQKDSFITKAIISKFEQVIIDGRITGISEITRIIPTKPPRYFFPFFFASMAIAYLAVFSNLIVVGFLITVVDLAIFVYGHKKGYMR